MGLGAAEGDVVDKCHLDPKLAKGKRPGEGDMGRLFCAALLKAGITPALTTWATIDTRISFLIDEATRWESSYGGLDKMPTGRAKCTRIVTNVDTGKDEVTDWPWEDWMWPMIRLGRQRKGEAAAAAVKKEEGQAQMTSSQPHNSQSKAQQRGRGGEHAKHTDHASERVVDQHTGQRVQHLHLQDGVVVAPPCCCALRHLACAQGARVEAGSTQGGNAAEGACSLPATHVLGTQQRRPPRGTTRFSSVRALPCARWGVRARGGVR